MRDLRLKSVAIAFLALAAAGAVHAQKAGDRLQVRLQNQSKVTFTRLEVTQPMGCPGFGDITYKVIEGALPLEPGEEMAVQFGLCGPVESFPEGFEDPLGDVTIDLSPACPPGVCNYSAMCGVTVPNPWPTLAGYELIPVTTYVQGAPESTPVGPMTSCKKASP